MPWKIFDYRDEHGRNVMATWAAEHLTKRCRIRLDQKVDMLEIAGPDLPPGLLSDSADPGIKKLRVYADNVEMRPLLCQGPIDRDEEFTFLQGAIERSAKFEPRDALERARAHMTKVKAQPQERRANHERFEK